MDNSVSNYFDELLQKYKTNSSKLNLIYDHFKPIIASWAKEYLIEVKIIGSVAQGTNINHEEDPDLDLFISLKHDTPFELEELYNSLIDFLKLKNYKLELRNISSRTKWKSTNVDFVVAKKKPGKSQDHLVWSRRLNKEVLSNPQKHIDLIKRSNKQNEIRLAKLWAKTNKVKADGFLMALTVVEALKNKPRGDYENNMLTILHYLAEKFEFVNFVDPANPSDSISENLTKEEIRSLVKKAKKSLKQDAWNDILW